jgi:large conductance mechanosensitive channel
MLKECKEFAMRGNVMDLAIGVIIGGAFGKIVSALIDDLIMPIIGKIIGNVDFSNLYVPLSEKVTVAMHNALVNPGDKPLSLVEAKKIGPVFAYGDFITVLLNFIILAFCIFMMVKIMNKIVKKQEAAVPPPTTSEKLLTEIRDLLNKK